MPNCDCCQGTGVISPASTFSMPMKCYRCAGTGRVDWKDVKTGDHACYIYEDPSKQLSTVAAFFSEGMRRHERCVYILGENTIAIVASAFTKHGIDVAGSRTDGSLVFLTANESYLVGGSFEPQAVIARFRDYLKDTLNEGFAGMRAAGEMSWALGADGHSERLVEYELMADHFYLDEQPRIASLCQYNRKRFSQNTLDGVKISHRLVFQD